MFQLSVETLSFPKFQSLCPFVHLSGANEFYKFLIFLISDLIIFFHILQQVDQKKMAMHRSKKYCCFFWKFFFCLGRWAILILKIMHPHNYGSTLRIFWKFWIKKWTKRYIKVLLLFWKKSCLRQLGHFRPINDASS